MKIQCLANNGKDLRLWEYSKLQDVQFGRFGMSSFSILDLLEIGNEYIVMGVITYNTYTGYLIDSHGKVFSSPCPLFKIVDPSIPCNWQFRLIDIAESIYPNIQAIIGYAELCTDLMSMSKLANNEETTLRIYYRRKIETES